MRKNHQEQFPLTSVGVAHDHAKELEAISDLLDAHPAIAARVAQDLVPPGVDPLRGRPGLSGDQVLRAAVLRQMSGWSYDELSFHLADSTTAQRFCRIGLGDQPPKRAALAANIKKITAQTWEFIHRTILSAAVRAGVERGTKTRVDCTVVDAPILRPTDSRLLYDAVRVLARLMRRASRHGADIEFSDRTRRAKRRQFEIAHAKKSPARRRAYRDLMGVLVETVEFVDVALPRLRAAADDLDLLAGAPLRGIIDDLEHFVGLAWQVLDQCHRRVVEGQSVPAKDKIVSIFEEHTDVIVKDRRETHFGHKICVATGPSSMVLDCVVLDGNPADATLVETMLDRHVGQFGRPPRQAAFDGGFASKANLELAKDAGVADVCFHKKRGLAISEMARSTWVYKKLRRFRAGVEAGISFLKRCFGLDRCRWRGLESFKAYVWAGVVSCNLLVFARHTLN